MTDHPEFRIKSFSRQCLANYGLLGSGDCSAEKAAMVDRLAYQAKELKSYEVTTDEMAMRIDELELKLSKAEKGAVEG